jgi:hypothetical protein
VHTVAVSSATHPASLPYISRAARNAKPTKANPNATPGSRPTIVRRRISSGECFTARFVPSRSGSTPATAYAPAIEYSGSQPW